MKWAIPWLCLIRLVELVKILNVILFWNYRQKVQCLFNGDTFFVVYIKPKFSNAEHIFNGQFVISLLCLK